MNNRKRIIGICSLVCVILVLIGNITFRPKCDKASRLSNYDGEEEMNYEENAIPFVDAMHNNAGTAYTVNGRGFIYDENDNKIGFAFHFKSLGWTEIETVYQIQNEGVEYEFYEKDISGTKIKIKEYINIVGIDSEIEEVREFLCVDEEHKECYNICIFNTDQKEARQTFDKIKFTYLEGNKQ